jgi:hypothetical protein
MAATMFNRVPERLNNARRAALSTGGMEEHVNSAPWKDVVQVPFTGARAGTWPTTFTQAASWHGCLTTPCPVVLLPMPDDATSGRWTEALWQDAEPFDHVTDLLCVLPSTSATGARPSCGWASPTSPRIQRRPCSSSATSSTS